MQLTMRLYQSDADRWRIRSFLREVFALNDRRQASWHLARFDYWFHPGVEIYEAGKFRLEEVVFLWETEDGRLAAALNPEGMGDAFLQVHPAFRSAALEAEMIATAENCLAAARPDGTRELCVWALEPDALRQSLLVSRGYVKSGAPEYIRRRSLEVPIPQPQLPPGYTVRSIHFTTEELAARARAGWKAFQGEDTPIDPTYDNDTSHRIFGRIPTYRRDLDLVIEAPNGDLAAFCTLWYDDVSRTAMFEPVGTVPAHQRRGLGKAIMYEGMRRLKAVGADLAFVSSYSDAAGGLYASVGFTEYDLLEPWHKVIA